MPFTEWPYGAATSLGVNRPNSVDSPLMAAIANTNFGKVLSDLHIQLHGWVASGGNISINKQRSAGYACTPNVVQLNQAVVYIERTPDTVQRDHIDWGFRVSGIYGDNYRYTTSYGLASYQFLKHDNPDGYDFPMVYGEGYLPNILQGLVIRAGRYISLPDIEAQLAPDNHMYTRSFYDFDSYTSTGGVGTLAVTRDLLLHLGISGGTETPTWHAGAQVPNLMPNNALYSGTQFKEDPGNQPSFTGCVRHSWDDKHNDVRPCLNAINRGYNNLQRYGTTYHHKFNDHWHLSVESCYEHQNGMPNANGAQAVAIYQAGGTAFSPQYTPVNGPSLAQCGNAAALRCRASAIGVVAYLKLLAGPAEQLLAPPGVLPRSAEPADRDQGQ